MDEMRARARMITTWEDRVRADVRRSTGSRAKRMHRDDMKDCGQEGPGSKRTRRSSSPSGQGPNCPTTATPPTPPPPRTDKESPTAAPSLPRTQGTGVTTTNTSDRPRGGKGRPMTFGATDIRYRQANLVLIEGARSKAAKASPKPSKGTAGSTKKPKKSAKVAMTNPSKVQAGPAEAGPTKKGPNACKPTLETGPGSKE